MYSGIFPYQKVYQYQDLKTESVLYKKNVVESVGGGENERKQWRG
jgi:hypothetical protein